MSNKTNISSILSKEHYENIRNEAFAARISMSERVRQIIESYYNQMK